MLRGNEANTLQQTDDCRHSLQKCWCSLRLNLTLKIQYKSFIKKVIETDNVSYGDRLESNLNSMSENGKGDDRSSERIDIHVYGSMRSNSKI